MSSAPAGRLTPKRPRGRTVERLTTWFWFDTEAEEAAEFYCSIFPGSRITGVTHYGEAGPREAGLVMTVSFELFGRGFAGLNGGPQHELGGVRVSLMVSCDSQDEVDAYWERLAEGGREIACGWVTDRYGVTWQIVPRRLQELLADPDREKAKRVMQAMLQMTKIEVPALEAAAAGGG